MSDRVAVFRKGRIAQVDTPETIYARPATRFVARFVGHANVIEASAAERLLGRRDAYALRPEKIRLVPADRAIEAGWVGAEGRVISTQYHGAHTRFEIEVVPGLVLKVQRQNEGDVPLIGGDGRVGVTWRPEDMTPIEPDESAT